MPKPLATSLLAPSNQKNKTQSSANGTSIAPASAYEEAQTDEIEVLKSIFMEDFEEVKTKTAWSRHAEKCFKLRIRAQTDANVAVTLAATLTATYPKSLPLLRIEDIVGVRQAFLEKINDALSTKPKEMLGEVMIHEIATTIQDILDDSASAQVRSGNLPSLEEERAKQEANTALITREEEAREQKRSQEAKEEEDRVLQRMLSEEVKRRQDMRPKRDSEFAEPTNPLTHTQSQVVFDHDVKVKDRQGFEVSFRTVTFMSSIGSGPITDVYCVCPNLHDHISVSLALKRASVRKSKHMRSILDLEKQLEMLKNIRHSNLVNVMDFRVETEKDSWRFDILTEFGNVGSLADLLALSDVLALSKARSFSVELLQALDHLHKNGIVHGDLHVENVLFSKNMSGTTTVKLADAGFQAELWELYFSSKGKQQKHMKLPESWTAPEIAASEPGEKSRKSDIWAFGIVLLQMLFGQSILQEYKSPQTFLNAANLSEPFGELTREIFRTDPRKRPTAFELVPHEFFRTDALAIASTTQIDSDTKSLSGNFAPMHRRSRNDSFAGTKVASRYTREWDEAGRLGKGGYGEVVKARNKVDGRVYAIKKVAHKSQSELSQVLSEVYLLATLNHPYVVRYYTAWPEDEDIDDGDTAEVGPSSSGEDGLSSADDGAVSFDFDISTGGLDFISSSGFPKVEFCAEDEDDDEDDESNDSSDESTKDDTSSIAVASGAGINGKRDILDKERSLSDARVARFTLYIQMEFCERHTLRDMIRKGIYEDWENVWQILRQVLEGLVHIHAHGIIHRDLKPENIFIDVGNNPKIGDFGLATSGQFQLNDKEYKSRSVGDDMTRSVGTTLYVAPEVGSSVGGNYTDKVDMYSMGIIFFEMCYPLDTAMERIQVLRSLREKDHLLPTEFNSADRALQGEIIESLVKHKPSERPSSAELLRSGKIPFQIEDETIRLALQSLTDDSSPYFHKVMSSLFSNGVNREVRDHLWDTAIANHSVNAVSTTVFQNTIRDKLTDIFRRHGAVETQRQMLFPRSDYYTAGSVVQLLDPSGTLLQLPFDLTLPHARAIARQGNVPPKSFTFGTVFRNSKSGGAPHGNREVDFDILSHDSRDLALAEAEVIKTMDDILNEFPSFSSTSMSFQLSHCDLLETIMAFCRIPVPQRSAVKDIVGKLNIQQWTWQKVRSELRAPSLGIPATSLDELARFDFRDTPEKCFARLQTTFAGTAFLSQIHEVFTHVSGLEEYCKRFGVHRRIYFSPLSSFNHKFYEGGIMFQCIFDTKKRDVIAAGGRYDNLIKQHRPRLAEGTADSNVHVVGINIAWDRLVNSMLRYLKHGGNNFLKRSGEAEGQGQGQWSARRCDVLVASFDPSVLRSVGVKLVADLWSHDIAAELAVDVKSPEELLTRYRDDKHSWIITIKHEESTSAKPDLKVKNLDTKEDADIRRPDLMSFLRSEIRDRDHREGTNDRAKIHRQSSQQEQRASEKKQNVQVLTMNYKSKKTNKWRVVESAQEKAQELIHSFADNPIASIDTRDAVLDMIRETRLSDPESWRRVVQAVPLGERKYIQDVHDLISTFKMQYETATRNCFIYNFRSGMCILYDMKL